MVGISIEDKLLRGYVPFLINIEKTLLFFHRP